MFQDKNEYVRSAAIEAMSELGTFADILTILPYLQDVSSEVRTKAFLAIDKLVGKG